MSQTNKLISLPNFSYTSLDFDSIVADIKKLILEHPEYNQEWDDFLESNAGRMFIEMMSYIMEKMTSRLDWVAQEMFVSTATQRQSLINILKLINYRPELPHAAKVNLTAKLTKWVEPFDLPLREKIIALDTNGNTITFECLIMATDGKPDYTYHHRIDTGTITNPITVIDTIPFYQGRTVFEDDLYMDAIDNEKITLEYSPVIENSIRIESIATSKEWPEVESFISPEAQQNGIELTNKVPPYIIEIDSENNATVVFGPASLVKIATPNERIKITYRIGGGNHTNVVKNAINQTKTYNVNNTRVTLIYTNPEPGFGGTDEERLDDAKLTAPISLRSANKTVTRKDYISHLEIDPLIRKAFVVGKENEPEEIYTEYGYHLPPLETWIYIMPERDNLETMAPELLDYNFRIGRPYTIHAEEASEEISLDSQNQTVFLTKYRQYKGYNIYITLHQEIDDGGIDINDWLASDSYEENIDYIINSSSSILSRITTEDGGNIPAGVVLLKVRYIYEGLVDHKNATVKDFSGGPVILDTTPNSLWPVYNIKITNKKGDVTYIEDSDYTINYETNTISLPTGTFLPASEKVIISYANNWVKGENDTSEEKLLLDVISDKKMICIDNKIKDSEFNTFDVAATIYCYKNIKKYVVDNIKEYLRKLYNINNAYYNYPISRAQFIVNIMKFDGVQDAEITYFGKDYNSYRQYVLGNITQETYETMNAEDNTKKIPCKYNEVLVLSNDEYEGAVSIENQRHGLTLDFSDAI